MFTYSLDVFERFFGCGAAGGNNLCCWNTLITMKRSDADQSIWIQCTCGGNYIFLYCVINTRDRELASYATVTSLWPIKAW